MNEQPQRQKSEMDEYYERSRRRLIPTPETPLQKAGCGAVIVGWFALLLLPFAMIWLATGYTITIPRGDVPEPDQQPRLQIELVMGADNRGLKFTRSQPYPLRNNELCVETNVSYALWQSEENDNAVQFCQCYQRQNADANWQFVESLMNTRCESQPDDN